VVAGRTIVALSCTLGAVFACHPAPAPPRASAAPPSAAAVFVHDEAGYGLHLADLVTGALVPIGPEREAADQPVWSPDGTRLAYRVGERVFVHSVGAARDATVAGSVDLEAARPYAFSVDGRRLAIAQRGGVAIAAITHGAADIAPAPLATYPDQRVSDLRWSPSGATLVALLRAASSGAPARLAWISTTGGATQLDDAGNAIRLLGWHDGALLVVEVHDGRERVVSVAAPGAAPSSIALSPPAGEDLSVIDYAAAPDRIILAAAGDPDDDTALRLAPPGGRAVPWLTTFPRLSQIELNVEGTWAAFVDRTTGGDRPGGSVFVVRVGANDARLVLAASAARSFSAPTPRPSR
jgi:dipeptidyl aminopeptidase/acylaminoacyl peptidase